MFEHFFVLDEALVNTEFMIPLGHHESKIFHFIDELLDCFTNLLFSFGARAHDAARAGDEKHGLRLLHAVNKAGKYLELIHVALASRL